jgi:peptide chain release factor 1
MNAGKAHSCGGAYFGSKQAAALNDVINAYESYLAAQEELIECKQMAKEAAGDADMLAMAQEESAGLKETLEALEQRITVLLLPSDPLDERNIMLEVRAGTVR